MDLLLVHKFVYTNKILEMAGDTEGRVQQCPVKDCMELPAKSKSLSRASSGITHRDHLNKETLQCGVRWAQQDFTDCLVLHFQLDIDRIRRQRLCIVADLPH